MRTAARRILACCTALLLAAALSVPCAALRRTAPVRVAFVSIPGFLEREPDGSYSGVAYEMLEEIAAYSGLQFRFQSVPLQKGLQALQDGETDLFLPIQQTPERQTLYEYSALPVCTNQAALLVRPDADIWYEDYAHFEGIHVGGYAGNRNNDRMLEVLAEHGCHVVLHDDYATPEELELALAEGREDAVLVSSNRALSNCRMVLTLPVVDSYLIARKGNRTELDKIDQAMLQIQRDNPRLMDNLEDIHSSYENISPSFTREERDFINSLGPVTVSVGPGDYQTAREGGGMMSVLASMEKLSGLKFEIVPSDTALQALVRTVDGQSELLLAMDHDYSWASLNHLNLSDSYFSYRFCTAQRGKTGKVSTVAVVRQSYIAYRLGKNTDGRVLIYCDTVRDCLELVRSGRADAACCTELSANYYAAMPRYQSLVFTTDYEFGTNNFCFGISHQSDARLAPILNKTLRCVQREEIDEAFADPLQAQTSFWDVYYLHPVAFSALVGVLAVLILLAVVLLRFNAVTKRRSLQLQKAMSAKSEFLSRMSHDMRTPMNAIIGLSGLIRQENHDPAVEEDLKKLELSGRFLLGLINDTLDMSKIQSGKLELHPEPFTQEEFSGEIRAVICPLMEEKRIAFRLDPGNGPACILTDKLRYTQIFLNLLSNAAKFTPPDGRVDVLTEYTPRPGGLSELCIRVRDSGIGISPEYLPHIFEPFSQERRETNPENQGTGLGLSIVKSIVTAMNGTITVCSEPGKGSEFTVTLPVQETEPPEKAAPQSLPDVSLRGRRILVAEDNAINTQVARRILEAQGCIVEAVENGRLAVESVAHSSAHNYDAVLMDIRMPEMDGLEATRAIRALPQPDAETLPIIAMTANAYDEDIRACREAGMNAHLGKPIDTALLLRTLAEQIARGTPVG